MIIGVEMYRTILYQGKGLVATATQKYSKQMGSEIDLGQIWKVN